MPPTAVIFDIGRVIVRLDLKRALAPFISAISASNDLGVSRCPEGIWLAIQADPLWRDWQEGRITPQHWYEYITRQLGITPSFEEFCSAWNSVIVTETILPDSLFIQLAKRSRLGLLSNTDPIHAAYLEDHFSFVRHFPVRIYSNEVGVSKPSPPIYRAALAALATRPPETLYIDDIVEYAEAARSLGLDAIRFQNPQQLAGELSQRGLIP